MKLRGLSALCAALLLTTPLLASAPTFNPDPEVFYLPKDKIVELKCIEATAVYATRQLNPRVRNFAGDETVLLLAYHPTAFLVQQKTEATKAGSNPNNSPAWIPS
ncbi:MAG: hypothetical protein HC904_10315 [Blastochloris sp.]|nr:hypothetical protein [Blastochloris sp.]